MRGALAEAGAERKRKRDKSVVVGAKRDTPRGGGRDGNSLSYLRWPRMVRGAIK